MVMMMMMMMMMAMISHVCVCMCGSCVGLCVIQSVWLLSILIIIMVIIISSRGGSVIHSTRSFIQRHVGITHIHQQSMIHDPITHHFLCMGVYMRVSE